MSVEQDLQAGRAPSTVAVSAVTGGVDWASEEHAVAIVDEQGRPIKRFSVTHTAPGLRRMIARLLRAGVRQVAIERPDGPVVDALLEAELTVFVIDPKQVKNLRGPATGRPGTRTTGSTPTSWLTWCVPTAPACAR